MLKMSLQGRFRHFTIFFQLFILNDFTAKVRIMNTQHFITPARFVKQNVVERMLPPQEASENCLFIKEDHGTVITS